MVACFTIYDSRRGRPGFEPCFASSLSGNVTTRRNPDANLRFQKTLIGLPQMDKNEDAASFFCPRSLDLVVMTKTRELKNY